MKKILVIQVFFIIVLVSLSDHIYAQLLRNFPIDSKLGELTEFTFPKVEISDEVMYLGVGLQIRDSNNHILPPNIVNKTGSIRYQLDAMGYVYRIWFLTSEEADLAEEQEDYDAD
tara:strand:- start:361 stop:705 length:345 start_codon:yes stop_codon:yes gene_type:complete